MKLFYKLFINNYINIKYKFLFYKIFFILLIISIIYFFQNFFQNELYEAEKYLKLFTKKPMLDININNYIRMKNPKISIISAIYNKENFISRFLASIQYQSFKEIEIILIDDCSIDNTVNIIEKLQKKDKRIILIKHFKNNGTLKSNGEYLLISDPDDILLNDILNKSYKMVKKFNYDILRFDACIGKYTIYMKDIFKKVKIKPIYQPELSSYIFYGKGYLDQIDFVLWNKFIKREILIQVLNSIDKFYLNQYMISYEDGLINFILYKTANSYYYIRNIGYYYLYNINSISFNHNNNKIIEKLIYNNFLYLKFIFQYIKKRNLEKNIFSYILNIMQKMDFNNQNFKNIQKNFNFYYKLIDLFLSSEFISLSDKQILENIKIQIKKSENKIFNFKNIK